MTIEDKIILIKSLITDNPNIKINEVIFKEKIKSDPIKGTRHIVPEFKVDNCIVISNDRYTDYLSVPWDVLEIESIVRCINTTIKRFNHNINCNVKSIEYDK
jgi:hypothetical protein